jgi:hypothetical protein
METGMAKSGTSVLDLRFTGDRVDPSLIIFADPAVKDDPISFRNGVAFMLVVFHVVE